MGLFSRKAPKTPVSCVDVVGEYGATIERLAAQGPGLHSSKHLPYEMPIIEAALLEVARRGDQPISIDVLKAGFIELASFRDGADGARLDFSTTPGGREQLTKWMAENGPKLKGHAADMDIIAQESAHRSVEWEARLAALRGLTHA